MAKADKASSKPLKKSEVREIIIDLSRDTDERSGGCGLAATISKSTVDRVLKDVKHIDKLLAAYVKLFQQEAELTDVTKFQRCSPF